MSSKLKTKLGLIAIITVASAFSLGFYGKKMYSGISSESKIKRIPSKLPGSFEKHLSSVNSRILNLSDIPESEDDEVHLQGVLKVNSPVSSLQVDWKLPSGVNIISGNQSEIIDSPEVNKEYYFDVVVSGFTKASSQLISFIVGTVNNGRINVVSTAVINSRPEDSLEYVAPQMMGNLEKVKEDYEKQ